MKIRIAGQQVIHYNQIVNMKKKEFKRLTQLLEMNGWEDATEEIMDYLNADDVDVDDIDKLEVCTFEKVEE